MTVEYRSNNSGGNWWLTDQDWFNLEKAGWKVEWVKDSKHYQRWHPGSDRFLGALATNASREGLSYDEAVAEWESIMGQSADEDGCECCGQPHYFSEN